MITKVSPVVHTGDKICSMMMIVSIFDLPALSVTLFTLFALCPIEQYRIGSLCCAQQEDGLSLAGYIPTTDVTYQSTIDIDQQRIEEILSQVSNSNTEQQNQMYVNDAYSLYLERWRTLSGMDGTAFRLPSDTNEFLPFFYTFFAYMGDSDYANDFIVAGYNGTTTTAGYSGNFKFNEFHLPGGLLQVIQLGTIILTLPQYIVRNLDVSLYECTICALNNTIPCTPSSALLDEAVAYYVGSIQDTLSTSSYDGYLMYGTADRLCQIFNTCDGTITINNGQNTIRTSRVNMIIMQQFINMQQSFSSGLNCNEAMMFRNILVTQLFLPMMQGIIRSTYYTAQDVVSEYCNADATMYTAAVLPLIHNCSEDDADLLFRATRPDRTIPTNATLVQEILQRNYPCMGISEENDVGKFDPTVMVEWGTCGQPTPAPILPVPVMTSTSTSQPIAPTVQPTAFLATLQPLAPIASPTTTSNCDASFYDNNGFVIVSCVTTMSFMVACLIL